jgi:NADH:ubiquinone oxidoreductase subunit 4 (subunit M)
MDASLAFLSFIVFTPCIGALLLAFVPGAKHELIRYITLFTTLAVLFLCVLCWFGNGPTQFQAASAQMQNVFNIDWIPSFSIGYFMGADGISFPLVMLTAVVSALAMGASWSIKKYVKAYCILFLLLETGMLGVFLSLDFFLFYVFWEVMLLPMYFLIGVWGGPRREYAAIKFFLYTLVGSVLMLIAILLLYFSSDLREIAKLSDLYRDNPNSQLKWDTLKISASEEAKLGRVITVREPSRRNAALDLLRIGSPSDRPLFVDFLRSKNAGASTAEFDEASNRVTVQLAAGATAAQVAQALTENPKVAEVLRANVLRESDGAGEVLPTSVRLNPTLSPVHTFNMLALAAIGQHTKCFDHELLFGWSLQVWAFLLLFLGFIVKVPSVPVHTWLPDAHVEAPTPISMILAGVLLKMGGYGIIRICYPICPQGGYDLAWFVCLIGVVSMVYGGFAALAQKDFKRMVAYSSVSHMGYVVLGLGVWSARNFVYNTDYWNMGVQGAMFQMIAHGISSSGMFFMVGVIYDRVHHRNLDEFGGLFGKMPVYTALSIGIFFAGLGLPGLCGFPGEVFVVLSVFKFSVVLAVISAAVVIITASYILWAIQRVYLGPEYKGPHGEHLTPSNGRENTIAGILFVGAIVFGIFPYHVCLKYIEPTVQRQVNDLAAWAKRTDFERSNRGSAPAQASLEKSNYLSYRPDPTDSSYRDDPTDLSD